VPELVSVNVAEPRTLERNGELVRTGIWKFPVDGRVAVRGVNVDGDEQADRSVHGGRDKAVYAYPREDLDWWEGQLGRDLAHGTFGENLTTRGLDVTAARVGERWRIGGVLLEVSEPRMPCWKLAWRMEDAFFPRRFTRAGRPDAYLRIVEEGELGAGDRVKVVDRPPHEVSVGVLVEAYVRDRSLAPRILEADALSDQWRSWASKHAPTQA